MLVNEIGTEVQEDETQAYHNWFFVVICVRYLAELRASDMLAEPNYRIAARSNYFQVRRSIIHGTELFPDFDSQRARRMTTVASDF